MWDGLSCSNETSKISAPPFVAAFTLPPHQFGLPASRAIICFCFFSLWTFCRLYSSLICTHSIGIIFFASMSIDIKILDAFQRIMPSEVGSDDVRFPCSFEPAIVPLLNSKIVSRLGVTAYCCLLQMINLLFSVLLDT